jgi:hypothetical protein
MENSNKNPNIKDGDVFEIYNYNNKHDDDDDDDNNKNSPLILTESKLIYLGTENIRDHEHAIYVTINENKKTISEIFKKPIDVFYEFINKGIYKKISGSNIHEIVLSYEKKKKEKSSKGLSSEVKTKILGSLSKTLTSKRGGRIKTTKKNKKNKKTLKIKSRRNIYENLI